MLTSSIRRRLLTLRLRARVPLYRIPLTANHRRLRLQWDHEHRAWQADWHQVVFSDFFDFKERDVKWSLHSASYLALRFNCDVSVVRWVGGVASEVGTNGVVATISAVTLLLVCELWTFRLSDPVGKN
ncbi:hypothetical protein TNCV_4789501 [Trichonephila clavipes]|nr:hypothetical protein TNCV_4789501 [Trichonephila clavipes]